MKVQGSVLPNSIWIKNSNNGMITVLLRKNIKEKINEEGDIIFEYDEIKAEISNRNNLIEYIENNFDLIFNEWLIKENLPKEPTDKERISALEDTIQILLGV